MKITRTKLLGTLITLVWMRVISLAIFAFFSSDTNPSSVIAVYNGIRFYPPDETPNGHIRTGYKYANCQRLSQRAAQFRFSAGLRTPVWNEDQLFVHKLFQTKVGKFLAITGALDSAERQIRIADIGIVDKDHARFHTTRHPLASFDV